MDAVDWRTQLQPDSRQRVVNKIMETLKRHLPFSGQEGIMELKKIAERIEEKIYSAAISQSDYLRKISMKMLTMETRSQWSMPNSQDAGGAEQALHAVDWRMQLQPDSQQRTVFKIMETLKRLHPFAGIVKILELKKMAEQFEEKIYSDATSQDDYLKKISMEIATLEAKHQDAIPCPLSNSSVNCGKIPDSGAQAGNISVGDWQEEVYQKIKAMKAIYFPELNNLYQNISSKIKKHDSLPDQLCQKLDKLKISKKTLDRLFAILLVSRNDLLSSYKENLWSYEMEILNILDANMPLKTVPSIQQGQLGQSPMQSMHLIPQVQPPESQTSSPMQSMKSQASLDSKTQKGNVGGDDGQEEVYQKIKAMKEIYLPELNDMYQKIVAKMQQHDSLPQQPKSEQLDKLKIFKKMLERIIAFLQVSKKNVLPGFKEKLSSYEMQILKCLNINRPRKPMPSMPSMLQGQLGQPHMQSMQQSQSLISQAQPHENQIIPLMQFMNSQGAGQTTQQSNVLHNSMSSLPGVSEPQPNVMNSLQPGSSMDSAQGNQLSSMQQVTSGSIQQGTASARQQLNINPLTTQSGVNMLQTNIPPLQPSSNMLQQQKLQSQQHKQIQQRQMLQKQQMLQQQQQNKQQLPVQMLQMIQQQQQLQQQNKQQLPLQMQTHQMPQLNQMNDVNEMKHRAGMGVKSGVFPQHLQSNQQPAYPHQQINPQMQQSQPFIPYFHPQGNQINPQMQSMNSQGALELMLQNSLSSLPGISAPQQPGRNLSLALGNQLSSVHLVNSGLIQQNAASASQQRKRSRKEQREDFNLNERPPAGSAFGN